MSVFPGQKLPSIFKKLLMALSGLVLVGFVIGHMIGNLTLFCGPDAINEYAHFLQTLPKSLLWGERVGLGLAAIIHAWMGILLTIENKTARPQGYQAEKNLKATFASRTMPITGVVLLFFIVFHLAHFTLRIVFPEFQSDAFYTMLDGERVYNVYKMVLTGFGHDAVAGFYILAVAALGFHLSHGFSSMFQTLGLKNGKWAPMYRKIALLVAWVLFLGFSAPPAAVLLAKYTTINLLPTPLG